MNGYDLLPGYMVDGMRQWIDRGIRPGSFLLAVLENDFMEACRCADDVNQHRLFDYAKFLYSYAPIGCYGSKENVDSWAEQKRLEREGES